MGLNTSLIGRHNYSDALAAINIIDSDQIYPKVCSCPVCGKYELYTFANFDLNTLWLQCNSCKSRGDIIAFAANCWNLSLPDTAEKFTQLNLITETALTHNLPDYIAQHARRSALELFWEQARNQLWTHDDDLTRCYLRGLNIKHENELFARLFGAATHEQVANLCRTLNKPTPNKRRKNSVFIVIPFYDLPAKMTGVFLLQCHEQLGLFTQFVALGNRKIKKPNAGFAFFDAAVPDDDPKFKDTLAVTDDIFWAIKAQAYSTETAGKLAPIVVAYSGTDAESYGESWRQYFQKTKIFHSSHATPELISRACAAGGYVSCAAIGRSGAERGILGIRKEAKTWSNQLKSITADLPESAAAGFITKLNITADKLAEFMSKHCPHRSANFAARVADSVSAKSCFLSPRKSIVEKTDGWWSATGQKIINVKPRVTTIVYSGRAEKMYCGQVTTATGDTYTFQAPAEILERAGLFAYVRNILTQHAESVVYERTWNFKSLQFALTLYPPQIVTVDTQYGWDANNKLFRFADYALDAGGKIKKDIKWIKHSNTAVFAEPRPAADLPLRDLVTPAHDNSWPWLICAAFLENVLAPMYDRLPTATALTANNFNAGHNLLLDLTCQTTQLTAPTKKHATNFLLKLARQEMTWPLVIFNTFGDDVLNNTIIRQFNQPIFARISPAAAAIAPSYGWRSISVTTAHCPAEIKSAIPTFIQHLLQNQFKPDETDLFLQLLAELNKWFATCFGVTFNIQHALSCVTTADDAHTALAAELDNAVQHNKINILPHPRKRRQPTNYLLQQHDTIWLNKLAIDTYFEKMRSPIPNWQQILSLLRKRGLYLGENTVNNVGGFLVPATWFLNKQTPQQLREIG